MTAGRKPTISKFVNLHNSHPDYNKACHIYRKYGLPWDDYLKLQEEQKGLCAICGLPEITVNTKGKLRNLAIDHCHTTGKVRALLCHKCNVMLGQAGDSIDLLNSAINYLQKHGS